jgi:hypothetical protein
MSLIYIYTCTLILLSCSCLLLLRQSASVVAALMKPGRNGSCGHHTEYSKRDLVCVKRDLVCGTGPVDTQSRRRLRCRSSVRGRCECVLEDILKSPCHGYLPHRTTHELSFENFYLENFYQCMNMPSRASRNHRRCSRLPALCVCVCVCVCVGCSR